MVLWRWWQFYLAMAFIFISFFFIPTEQGMENEKRAFIHLMANWVVLVIFVNGWVVRAVEMLHASRRQEQMSRTWRSVLLIVLATGVVTSYSVLFWPPTFDAASTNSESINPAWFAAAMVSYISYVGFVVVFMSLSLADEILRREHGNNQPFGEGMGIVMMALILPLTFFILDSQVRAILESEKDPSPCPV